VATLAKQEREPFSYKDYCKWTDDGRWELIDGAEYDISPAPSRIHQKLSGELFVRIYNVLKDRQCDVYAAPFDVRLSDHAEASDEDIFTVVQPDIVVVCDESKLDERGCMGAPDLVIEILSPYTAAKDLKIKRDLYEKYGVGEYWLVHPTDKTFMVYCLSQDKQYAKAEIYSGQDILESTVIEGLKITLTDLFGVPPEPASSKH
jgi:Uma2 family endonuclease